MEDTGIFASKEDTEKLQCLVRQGWQPGQVMIVFSCGEGIRRDQAPIGAKKICHQLALDYGLPEIDGYYGITQEGQFVSV